MKCNSGDAQFKSALRTGVPPPGRVGLMLHRALTPAVFIQGGPETEAGPTHEDLCRRNGSLVILVREPH